MTLTAGVGGPGAVPGVELSASPREQLSDNSQQPHQARGGVRSPMSRWRQQAKGVQELSQGLSARERPSQDQDSR